MLSGFLIGGIILKQVESGQTAFKDFVYFWIRRWFRTLPNYFLVLILNIILLYLFSGEMINGLSYYFVFLQNFSSPQSDFFSESWSLSIEEFAYIVGPLLLYISIQFVKQASKDKLFLIVTGVIIVGSAWMRYLFHTHNEVNAMEAWSRGLRKVVIYRMDSIYYGFACVYLMKYFKSILERYKVVLLIAGIILFMTMHLVLLYANRTPENTSLFFNVFYLPLVSISLLLFFPFLIGINSSGYVKILITKLSIISYALYLLNYSVVLLGIQHFIGVTDASPTIKVIIFLAYWCLSIYLSQMLYTYFEKPMTNLRDKPFFKMVLS